MSTTPSSQADPQRPLTATQRSLKGGGATFWPDAPHAGLVESDWLLVEPYPTEKYESIGMIIPNIWENEKCSKPPTSFDKTSNMEIPQVPPDGVLPTVPSATRHHLRPA